MPRNAKRKNTKDDSGDPVTCKVLIEAQKEMIDAQERVIQLYHHYTTAPLTSISKLLEVAEMKVCDIREKLNKLQDAK